MTVHRTQWLAQPGCFNCWISGMQLCNYVQVRSNFQCTCNKCPGDAPPPPPRPPTTTNCPKPPPTCCANSASCPLPGQRYAKLPHPPLVPKCNLLPSCNDAPTPPRANNTPTPLAGRVRMACPPPPPEPTPNVHQLQQPPPPPYTNCASFASLRQQIVGAGGSCPARGRGIMKETRTVYLVHGPG